MAELTGHERIGRILRREKADRIGLYEHFWSDTRKAYVEQGFLQESESFDDHFNFDLATCGAFNFRLDLDFSDVILEETEDLKLVKDGNGATLRWHKKNVTTPEHVDFSIKERKQWEEMREKLTNVDVRRINFDNYRNAKEEAKKKNKFFCWAGVNVFELMHPICGHEHMLYGMADDPDWVKDMVKVYSDLILSLQEILFEKEGYPDGIFYYEDMGFKERPFMSPAMYKEFIFPAHKRTIDFVHAKNLPVIMHSCGFVEPFLPYMVEAGIDCLQAIEVKSGMDLIRIYKNYGEVLSLMGGMDVRVLFSDDKTAIDKELEAKIPIVKQGFGYILHSDHSIPGNVKYENLKYFIEKGLEMGTYS